MIHGEALVAVAAWALGEAEVNLADGNVPWPEIVESGQYVVLHDPLCPMTPPDFIAACVAQSTEQDRVVVGVRPVTDTVKVLAEGHVGGTVDRESLVGVCSPIVLPPEVVAGFERLPTTDFVALTGLLRQAHDVALVGAPPEARRVASAEDLRVLAALTTPE